MSNGEAESGMTRRQLLRLAAVAAAGATLPACSDGPGAADTVHDVVVIGAGLSGLTAASDLIAAGVESVVVLEARDRVGGRTLNQQVADGVVVEAGGQWAARAHDRLITRARGLGVETFRTWDAGDELYLLGGRAGRGPVPPVSNEELLDYAQAVAALDALALTVPIDEPWRAADAAALDATTLDAWLRAGTTTPGARLLFFLGFSATLGYSTAISLLWALFYVHAAGGVAGLFSVEGGEQENRFVGGSQLVSLRMAEALGDRVVLAAPVERVVQEADRVRVETARGTFRARRAIVAMMPADAARIVFEPALPAERAELLRAWPGTNAVKAHAVYATPFWRSDGLNGQVFSDVAPVNFVFDNSPPEGTPGILLVLTSPELLPSDPEARKRAILDGLAVHFGPRARDAIGFLEKRWDDDGWSAGCVSPVQPGLLTGPGRVLREPVGRIHWAGTETAAFGNGYMEGAVRAGERVAREVVEVL